MDDGESETLPRQSENSRVHIGKKKLSQSAGLSKKDMGIHGVMQKFWLEMHQKQKIS